MKNTPWTFWNQTLDFTYHYGVQAVVWMMLLALALGAGLVLQFFTQFETLSGSNLIYNIFVTTILRDLGPLLVSLLVIARSGAAYASEIAHMRVQREFEALEVMAISPLRLVFAPRFVAGVLSLLVLGVLFSWMVLFSGHWTLHMIDASSLIDFNLVFQQFRWSDLCLVLLKLVFSGAIIFSVSAWCAWQVGYHPGKISIVTTQAVMGSTVMTIVVQMILGYLGNAYVA